MTRHWIIAGFILVISHVPQTAAADDDMDALLGVISGISQAIEIGLEAAETYEEITDNLSPKNTNPSSGRRLARGHWLQCSGGYDQGMRSYVKMDKATDEKIVAAYVPHLGGSYSFQVDEVWREDVSEYGTSCVHCGKKDDGTCDTCSWWESKKFSRPWSTQTVSWQADWTQDQKYRAKRTEWLNRPDRVVQEETDLQKLIQFDPNRPTEYFLFPGEYELLSVTNTNGNQMTPIVGFAEQRYEYEVKTTYNGRTAEEVICDDRDIQVQSWIKTGDRRITPSPNSIVFKEGWVSGEKDAKGELAVSPGRFKFVDLSALAYEQMNIPANYQDTQVEIRLKQINRRWGRDMFITKSVVMKDTQSMLDFEVVEDHSSVNAMPYAEFVLNASDLLRTPWRETPFELAPGNQYELCARMIRNNNIYYETKTYWWGSEIWSDWKCAAFTYAASAKDLRNTGRWIRDGFANILPPLW